LFDACPDKPIATFGVEARYACIIRIGIGIVALFARLDDPVATAWQVQGALAGTSVTVVRIAVIALFEGGPDKPITAKRFLAFRAGIGGVEVSVIALLDAKPHESIAALCEKASDARIVAVRITVVALFEGLKDSIAAKPWRSTESTTGTRCHASRAACRTDIARAANAASAPAESAGSSRRAIAA
jgi:hypothetical protein